MKKISKKSNPKFGFLLKMVRPLYSRFFTESTSIEKKDPSSQPGGPDMNIRAELLQRFTVDIIRERVVITL